MIADRQRPVLFFDGLCNLCSNLVQFVLKYEKTSLILFAALQSNYAKRILPRSVKEADAVVLLVQGNIFTGAGAVFKLAGYLRFPWGILQIFRFLPQRLNDRLYRFMADKRFDFFGRRQSCMYLVQGNEERFLE